MIDPTKMWNYRVVRQATEDGAGWLSVQEMYYDDDEKPMAHTIDLQVEGSSIVDLRKQLQMMLWSLDKEVVEEIKSEVSQQPMEDRMLSLEMENAEMRDRLKELGDEIKERGLVGYNE